MSHLLYPTSIDAQPARNSQWTDFKQEDGLISNDVWSILKSENAIWFGTGAGVSRFDGTWTSFPTQTNFSEIDSSEADANLPSSGGPRSLATQVPPGRILTMTRSASDEMIWIGTDQGHIARWDGEEWFHILTLTDDSGTGSGAAIGIQVLQFVNAELWIGTKAGLWVYTTGDPTPQLSPVEVLGTRSIYAITHQLLTKTDVVWVGTEEGLWRKQGQVWSSVSAKEGLQSAAVYTIWVDSQNTIWLGSETGAVHRNPERKTWELFPTNDQRGNPTRVQALAGDSSGSLWAGTDGGGARKFIDGGLATLEFSTNTEDFKTDLIRDITIDDDGSIWFGTPNGVIRYQERAWWTAPSGGDQLEWYSYVNDLLVDQEDALWIATGGAGIRLKKRQNEPEVLFRAVDGLPGDSILALAQDGEGGIWAAGFEGVARFIGTQWTTPIDVMQLPSPIVTDIFVENQSIWLGTEGGLVRFDLQTRLLDIVPTLTGRVIQALSMDTTGRLWVMTEEDGLWLKDTGESLTDWTQFSFDETDPSSFPIAFIETGDLAPDANIDGGMWIAVRGFGLIHWDGETWRDGDPGNELPNDLLHKLFIDTVDGSLWVGNEDGVSHFDGITWGSFDLDDGLRTPKVFAIVQSLDGHYWFGGNKGLSYYQPEKTAPWIRIESLSGPASWIEDGLIQATISDNEEILLNLTVGDLQTAQEKLHIFYRLTPIDQASEQVDAQVDDQVEIVGDGWKRATNLLPISVDKEGEYELALWVRDPSFNYSSILRQPIQVVPSPVVIHIPLIGAVAQEGFQAIAVLGGVIFLLVGYVSFDMLRGRRRSVGAVNRSYNPYISGEPVRREDMFFGRHVLLQRIVDTLHNNSIMIHGERRIGKTTLLYQLSNQLREIDDPDYWFAPVYIDLEGTAQHEFFHFFIEEIVAGLSSLPHADDSLSPAFEKLRYHDSSNSAYSDREFNRDLHRVIRTLRKYVEVHQPDKQLRLILLLDEMDVMSRYDHLIQQQLRRIFMRDFAATVGAVVAGIQISKEWDRVESPWYNLFNEIEVEPFTEEMATELLVEPVRAYYQYDAAAIDLIVEYSDGRPFRVQQYGLASVSNMLADGRRRIKLEDVEIAHLSIQNSYTHSDAGLPA